MIDKLGKLIEEKQNIEKRIPINKKKIFDMDENIRLCNLEIEEAQYELENLLV